MLLLLRHLYNDALSSYVQVPINPDCPNAKRNFWKVDESKITPKILRRHFRGLRDVFPDFYENMEMSSLKNETENMAICKRPEAEKFSSQFSIESLLQRESSAPLRNRPAPCATRNPLNAFVGLENGDHGLACKRKIWDWPHPTSHADFSGSYPHFSFPNYSLGQMNEGCSSSSGSSKTMHSVSDLSYCTAPDNIRQFAPNVVTWVYM